MKIELNQIVYQGPGGFRGRIVKIEKEKKRAIAANGTLRFFLNYKNGDWTPSQAHFAGRDFVKL